LDFAKPFANEWASGTRSIQNRLARDWLPGAD
jgi:hypothetical protein